jgi:hypothetical protein
MYDKDFRGSIRSFFRRDPCIVLHLPGLAGSAGGLVDVSGNKYNATARNTPASYHGRFGGHAYRLVNADGTAPKYFDVPGSATITWAAGTKLSVIFWVYFTLAPSETTEANFRFIEKGADSSGGASGNFNISFNGSVIGFAYTNSAQSATYSTSGASPAWVRFWNCIGLTYAFPTGSDATPPAIYINGVRSTVPNMSGPPNGTVRTATGQSLTLGADQYSIAQYASDCRGLNGILDEMAFWKGRIVSPVEMAAYYRTAMRHMNPMFRLTDAAAAAGGGSAVPVFHSNYSRRRRAA